MEARRTGQSGVQSGFEHARALHQPCLGMPEREVCDEGLRAHSNMPAEKTLKMKGREAGNGGGLFERRLIAIIFRQKPERAGDPAIVRRILGRLVIDGVHVHRGKMDYPKSLFDPNLAVSRNRFGAILPAPP